MYKVVIPTLNPNIAEAMVHLAAALAGISSKDKKQQVKIIVLGIVIVPEESPLGQGAGLVKAYRTMLRYIPPESDEQIEVRTEVRVAREVWQGIEEQVREEKADLLLMHWKGSTQTPGAIYGTTNDALLLDPPCDVVLARLSNLPTIKKVLIPVRGGGYNNLALRLATKLCNRWEANPTVLRCLPPPEPVAAIQSFEDDPLAYSPAFADSFDPENSLNPPPSLLSELPPNSRIVTLQGNPADLIIDEAENQDLVIIGASGTEMLVNSEGEPMAVRLARELNKPLLVVKRHLTEISQQSLPHAEDERLAETLDQWFAQNTFHYREFRTMSSLTLLKERNNLSISLVFPVYGRVQPMALADAVRRARIALMHDCALVDEIIISAPGAQFDRDEINLFLVEGSENEVFYLSKDSPTPSDSATGPGEALWQALREVRGDIVVWADPSMVGFEARQIYGLVGPLLTDLKFMLAGGFFSYEDETGTHPVLDELTELSVRPLLGGFFPKLSGLINPLSLIGAARRDHLEKLSFFTGSGFLAGMAIDTLRRTNSLMSIIQVDLGGAPDSLCPVVPQRTTAEVMNVILRRLQDRYQSQTNLGSFFNPSVKAIHKEGTVFSLKVTPPLAPNRELPPLLYTPGYHRHQF